MKSLLVLFLSLAACASPTRRGNDKIPVSIYYKEKNDSHHSEKRFSYQSENRLKTNLNLEPGEKTLLGGITTKDEGKEAILEQYYILAEPIGEVIRFTLTKNEKIIAQMQLLNRPGDKGEIDGTMSRTEIRILDNRKAR